MKDCYRATKLAENPKYEAAKIGRDIDYKSTLSRPFKNLAHHVAALCTTSPEIEADQLPKFYRAMHRTDILPPYLRIGQAIHTIPESRSNAQKNRTSGDQTAVCKADGYILLIWGKDNSPAKVFGPASSSIVTIKIPKMGKPLELLKFCLRQDTPPRKRNDIFIPVYDPNFIARTITNNCTESVTQVASFMQQPDSTGLKTPLSYEDTRIREPGPSQGTIEWQKYHSLCGVLFY
ncbi:hypothetical protein TWF730_003591 [Orbilia blumenaviensis]|uniref:Uncharacterized protein n=1 Tax=Orbilia blumenaviensis TaxID=1796055 RepID=A0AAV9U4X0_9PEZI